MAIRTGIYIHWPYCRSKCPYCDFFSKAQKNVPQDMVVESYLEDIKYYAERADNKKVGSVFFGGGTPSLLSARNVERIINQIAACWTLEKDAEVSLEANPNTDKPGMFADLKQAGINRLSLGIQSLEESSLKFLGRTHSVAEALRSADEVLRVFDNHSADMIYARPEQCAEKWHQELVQLCELGFRHLSLYQLTIEDGTVFAKKGIEAAEEGTAIWLYDLSAELLAAYGYGKYEISNYAQSGFECRHNKLYWQGDDYAGIGNGAHGRLHLSGRMYATTHPRECVELSSAERAQELILMGLRLDEGINKAHFNECCGLPLQKVLNIGTVNALLAEGFIEDTSQFLRATAAGQQVLNKIIEELVCDAPVAVDNEHQQNQKQQH